MAESKIEERNTKDENNDNNNEAKKVDPELFSCLLQPPSADSDPQYIGMRRLLLYRKAQNGVLRRLDWRCNGKGYVAYRNYIRRPKNWETLQTPSYPSTPGNSGRWVPSPLSHMFEVESLGSSRDLRSGNLGSSRRTSFSSTTSDNDRPRRLGPEPAYSFVGMHCIFDQCKAAVTVIKFGHMSSDLLAYGAADGTMTVCTVSDPPTVMTQLKGHSKEVTVASGSRLIRETFNYAPEIQGILLHRPPGSQSLLKYARTLLSKLCTSFTTYPLRIVICHNYTAVGFNTADLWNICTKAGMFAFYAERDNAISENFMKSLLDIWLKATIIHLAFQTSLYQFMCSDYTISFSIIYEIERNSSYEALYCQEVS